MHGVGLRGMASLVVFHLERQCNSLTNLHAPETWTRIEESMRRLKPRIIWSDIEAAGATQTAKKLWREEISNRQNTNQDISALCTFLRKESLHLDSKVQQGS